MFNIEDEQINSKPKPSVQTGIFLIGVYVFATNIGKFLSTFIFQINEANFGRDPIGTVPHGLSFSNDLLTYSITVIFSLILVFGSKKIGSYFYKMK